MIDTGGTIVAAAEQLKLHGATQVHVLSTHGVFSDPAVERLEAAPIDAVVVTDTLALSDKVRTMKKLRVVTLAPLIASAVKAIFYDESVSKIFGGENHT
jgi:ribose-phosphate pyrophosphokinase